MINPDKWPNPDRFRGPEISLIEKCAGMMQMLLKYDHYLFESNRFGDTRVVTEHTRVFVGDEMSHRGLRLRQMSSVSVGSHMEAGQSTDLRDNIISSSSHKCIVLETGKIIDSESDLDAISEMKDAHDLFDWEPLVAAILLPQQPDIADPDDEPGMYEIDMVDPDNGMATDEEQLQKLCYLLHVLVEEAQTDDLFPDDEPVEPYPPRHYQMDKMSSRPVSHHDLMATEPCDECFRKSTVCYHSMYLS